MSPASDVQNDGSGALAGRDPGNDTSTVIATDPLVWVEDPHGAGASPEDGIDVCLMQAPCIYRQAALGVLSRTGSGHRETLTANSVQSVRNAVLSGLGCSVLGASCPGGGLRPSRRLQAMEDLPGTTLSLHGNDHRKGEMVNVQRALMADHLDDRTAAN